MAEAKATEAVPQMHGLWLYPIRDTHALRKAVEKARAELLNQDESIKDRCIEKVHVSYIMSYVI